MKPQYVLLICWILLLPLLLLGLWPAENVGAWQHPLIGVWTGIPLTIVVLVGWAQIVLMIRQAFFK